jgi:hypothetical protein
VTPQAPPTQPWRKSTYSDTARQCVEVAQTKTACLVRDTTNRSGHQLTFTRRAWTTFTQGITGGSPADE